MDLEEQKIGEISDESFLFKEVMWKIPKDKILQNLVDQDVKSPQFSFAGATWMFHVYPYGRCTPASKEWVEIGIKRLDYTNLQQYVFCKFYFKTIRGKELNARHVYYIFNVNYKEGWLLYMRNDNFSLNMKNLITTKGDIVMVCQMRTLKMKGKEVFSQTKITHSVVESPKKSSSEERMSPASTSKGRDCTLRDGLPLPGTKTLRDFKDLYLSQEDCDVTINVKGFEFSAHRNILKARSSVFASTFRNDMKEKATGVIDIEDCDPSSFSDFLCFLYCGNVDKFMPENVFSLFTAADKYDVQDLRLECMEFMKQNLSVDTFCDTIALALQHSEKAMIELTTDFFIKHLQEIIVTLKWQSFLIAHPIESNELLIKALVSNKN